MNVNTCLIHALIAQTLTSTLNLNNQVLHEAVLPIPRESKVTIYQWESDTFSGEIFFSLSRTLTVIGVLLNLSVHVNWSLTIDYLINQSTKPKLIRKSYQYALQKILSNECSH